MSKAKSPIYYTVQNSLQANIDLERLLMKTELEFWRRRAVDLGQVVEGMRDALRGGDTIGLRVGLEKYAMATPEAEKPE